MKRTFPIAAALVLVGSLAWSNVGQVISQVGKTFTPGEITIARGAVLRIANDDRVLHHVYVESEAFNFDSGEQPPGKTVELRFPSDGRFDVLCAIHPKMKLTVNVR